LRWAVQDCAATRDPLHVVLAHGATAGPGDLETLVSDELSRVPGREPEVDVTVTTGEPATALLAAAAESSQLVLGCGRKVAPVGPGVGKVLRVVLPRSPVPLVLVGPQAVLTAPRRLLVVSSTDAAVSDWAIERVGDLPLRLLTTWYPRSITTRPSAAERRHAHLAAVGRHHAVRATLSGASHRPVRADVTEGLVGEVVPQRLTVGDLVVVAAGAARALPFRTLRSPVVLVPPGERRIHLPAPDVVDLRDDVREGLQRS
jgi:hypothetical protein